MMSFSNERTVHKTILVALNILISVLTEVKFLH